MYHLLSLLGEINWKISDNRIVAKTINKNKGGKTNNFQGNVELVTTDSSNENEFSLLTKDPIIASQ